ncbi:XRE family transcriptional regulator [Nonomuraea sp. B19D2]|uniref:XRE family transcriptional regulator n=1 Tax=Nonomuraea sp. B19D2 TaxID=3159561 RepID=UPI0032DA617E
MNRLYQATHYDEAGRRLPGLIVATELGSRHAPAAQRQAYQTLRSLTYHSATTTLRRVGEAELAWVAADRSLAAAQEADRPLLAAVSAYRLGYVLVRLRETERALHLVLQAADALQRATRRPTPRTLPIVGALYLVAVTAAAAAYDQASVRAFLAQARQVADTLGEDRNDFWTAFGTTNVTIHEISAAVEFGDTRRAIDRGETLNLAHLSGGLVGRRAQVHLDLAPRLRLAAQGRRVGQHAPRSRTALARTRSLRRPSPRVADPTAQAGAPCQHPAASRAGSPGGHRLTRTFVRLLDLHRRAGSPLTRAYGSSCVA